MGRLPTNAGLFQTKLLDPAQPVFLYGTTPPRHGALGEEIETAAGKLVERLSRLALDALVVYDVQDESSRTSIPRPFPFLPTLDSRVYARRLMDLTGLPAVTYRCVAVMGEAEWETWLSEAGDTFQLRYLTPVGAPSSQGVRLPLSRATRMAAAHRCEFMLAGVAIAERHSAARSESRRMLQKAKNGCRFFISQGIYHCEPTLQLLRDYARDCREAGIEPQRVILTFTPCGRPKTMEFLKWLGIAIPAETEAAILSDPSPLAKSIEICCANLRRILEEREPSVPLGVNVESVSIRKDEIDASVDLFQALREIAGAGW